MNSINCARKMSTPEELELKKHGMLESGLKYLNANEGSDVPIYKTVVQVVKQVIRHPVYIEAVRRITDPRTNVQVSRFDSPAQKEECYKLFNSPGPVACRQFIKGALELSTDDYMSIATTVIENPDSYGSKYVQCAKQMYKCVKSKGKDFDLLQKERRKVMATVEERRRAAVLAHCIANQKGDATSITDAIWELNLCTGQNDFKKTNWSYKSKTMFLELFRVQCQINGVEYSNWEMEWDDLERWLYDDEASALRHDAAFPYWEDSLYEEGDEEDV